MFARDPLHSGALRQPTITPPADVDDQENAASDEDDEDQDDED
ncbi:hypothetical protein [Streptomyces anulatus]|nr:hypothetical protein [Streptomyces sp. HB372]